MFHTAKPAAQPRTLRTIAETNYPANMPTAVPPMELRQVDNANSAQLAAGATPRPSLDPAPFGKLSPLRK